MTATHSFPPPKTAIVVGAGILGAAFAYTLSKAGLDVTVMEAVAPHAKASGGSWAWINAVAADKPAYRALREAAFGAYHDLDQSLEGTLPIDWTSTLLWDPRLTVSLTPEMPGYEQLDRAVLKGRFPQLKAPPESAWISSRDGLLDGAKAVEVLLRASGAMVQSGRAVTGLAREGDRITGVTTDYGSLTADVTIIAAGIATPGLVEALAPLPTQNRAGLLVLTQPVPTALPMALWSEQIHVKQMRDGRLMIGEASHAEGALDAPDALAESMLRATEALLDVGPLVAEELTIETRPIPSDGYPVIGVPDGVNGVYIAMMHSGMTLAAISARLGTAEILTGSPAPLLEPFRIERFRKE